MKKYHISTIFIISLLALLFSCTTTPEFSEYQPKPAREKAAISGQLLFETEWIPAGGSYPNLRLIDFGRKGADYRAAHIPGAAFMDRQAVWNKVNGIPGMLPPVETMVAELEKAGVSNDSTVVIYDNNSGLWASRLFWALAYLGHEDIHILNGGWTKWIHENRAVQTASYLPPRGKFIPHIQPDLLATGNWILENLNNPELQIIDTRSLKEHAGEDVRAARGGHIPGAVNINWISNLKSDGSKTFAPKAKLTNLYDSRKISKDKIIVTHCQTGVRGTHTYFVLKHLGYPRVRVYDGSWAEWGNNIRTPVITEATGGRK
jgi:thiosulfate/3-mercaptopyruvate sulfurtransferase